MFRHDRRAQTAPVNLWPALLLAAMLLFPLDIAVRRLRVTPAEIPPGSAGRAGKSSPGRFRRSPASTSGRAPEGAPAATSDCAPRRKPPCRGAGSGHSVPRSGCGRTNARDAVASARWLSHGGLRAARGR